MMRFIFSTCLVILFTTSMAFASSGSSYSSRSSKWNKSGCEYNGLEIEGGMAWVQTEKESSFTVKVVERDQIDEAEIFFYVGEANENLPRGRCGVLWLTSSAGNALLKFKQMLWNEGYHWIGMMVPCPELAGVATAQKKSDVELYFDTFGDTGNCPTATVPTSASLAN